MFKKLLIFLTISTGMLNSVEAQYTIVGVGNYTGSNFYGPINSSTIANQYSRYAYIYPKSVLGNLKHKDSINSIEFYTDDTGTLSGASMKIYLRMTSRSVFPAGKISWTQEVGAFSIIKVYDGNPGSLIAKKEGFISIPFNIIPFYVDTTIGDNLQVMVEYTQSGASNRNLTWRYDNRFSVTDYQLNQTRFVRGTGTLADTLKDSTDAHPYMTINFPRFGTDMSVLTAYSLGKLPVPLGNPDSLWCIIRNTGKNTLTNHKIYLKSIGKNKLSDSFTVASIKPAEQQFLKVKPLNPTNIGMDTILIFAKNDANPIGDTAKYPRLATQVIYSYKNVNESPAPGGIGFNGSTGDFVAKFFSSTSKAINQISVNFGQSGRTFRIGIWDAKGLKGRPGKLLWESTNQTSTLGTFVMDVTPAVSVNGNFYVGVRQTGTTNVAFGYQIEEPVRPGTFFYAAPLGDTNWLDFAPDAPFRFMIEPRIQSDHDVAVTKMVLPKNNDTLDISKVKMMAPKCEIYNYGNNNEKGCFNVTINIKRYGTLLYTSTRCDSLLIGQRKIITFDSTFLPVDLKTYDVEAFTSLGIDQLPDNDTFRTRFFIAKFKDVGPDLAFQPAYGGVYELNRDTITPIVRVQNFGFDPQTSFNVRCQIKRNKTVLFTEVKTLSLNAEATQILAFSSWPCKDTGNMILEVTSLSANDNFRINDTLRVPFRVQISNDVAMYYIKNPLNNQFYKTTDPGFFPKAVFENVGALNQDTAFTFHMIFKRNNVMVYRDSFSTNSFKTGQDTVTFYKKFNPTVKGLYNAICYFTLKKDQIHQNDTAKSNFSVGYPLDISANSVVYPLATDSLGLLTGPYQPKVSFSNIGYAKNNTASPFVCKIYFGKTLAYTSVKNALVDSGKTTTVNFDNTFIPTLFGTYTIEAFANDAAEIWLKNDTIRSTFKTFFSNNVTVSQVLLPKNNDTFNIDTASIVPSAQLCNRTKVNITQPFSIFATIFNSNGQKVYETFVQDTIGAGSCKTIKFTKTFVPKEGGNYRIEVRSAYLDDQVMADDTAKANFLIASLNDIAIDSILIPISKKSYIPGNGFIPKIRIKNAGTNDLNGIKVLVSIRNSKGINVYKDSVTTTQILGAQNAAEIDMTNSFVNFSEDSFEVLASATINGDKLMLNNNKKHNFYQQWPLGIKNGMVQGITVFPNPTQKAATFRCFEVPLYVEIVGVDGKIQFAFVPESKLFEINTESFSSGVYMVSLTFSGNTTKRVKLIKE